ncbi:MAG: hypothetical protein DI547_13730 [Sphingobium sp.]|nr:MAG: hypothetical protein DI547_13730 [Sphingobium sp.]
MTQTAPGGATPVRDKLLGLQLGRAVAALSVVITHAVAHPYAGAPAGFHLFARYGVTLFFLISGYIMVVTTGPGAFDPRRFVDRRIRRIVPIYYFANLVLALATIAAPAAFRNTTFDPLHIIQSLLFIPAYMPNGTGFIWPFFRLGWTLNYEMFFYLLFAACFALQVRQRATVLTVLFVGLFGVGLLVPFTAAIPRFYTQVDILGFIAGMWMGTRALSGPLRMPAMMRPALLLASLIVIGFIGYHYRAVQQNPLTQIALIAACAVHLDALIAYVDGRGRTPPRFAILIGDASYSIYLFHMFAVGIVTALARKLPAFMLFPMMALSAVAGVAIGLLVYRLVEAQINSLLGRRRLRPSASARETRAVRETAG